MGILAEGVWQEIGFEPISDQDDFVRSASQFRGTIVAPQPDITETDDISVAEAGRYHLYVSLACPWCHRTLIYRHLKKLEKIISVTIVEPVINQSGWEFQRMRPNRQHTHGAQADPLFSDDFLYQIYQRAQPQYTGRVTVPALWDKQKRIILNNESSDIIRFFNQAFDSITGNNIDFAPQSLLSDIDNLNQIILEKINHGVYLCGFATAQEAYDLAAKELFEALDEMEERLEKNRYLLGEQLTESDWYLFPTLLRFDCVYYSLFKTNLRRIEDYPHLSHYIRELYQIKGMQETINFQHIIRHYYMSLPQLHPSRIQPIGFVPDYNQTHYRGR